MELMQPSSAVQQLSLLEELGLQAPLCQGGCGRPAARNVKVGGYHVRCGGHKCLNRNRTCHICQTPFTLGTPGAGTKYCSPECQSKGYHRARDPQNAIRCAWCNKVARGISRKWSDRFLWPYICSPCLKPLKYALPALKRHRVPHERARRLIDDPGCEICGTNLLARVETRARQWRSPLAVDHDHACCPVQSKSCGKCIRGLLCGSCNTAAGMVLDDPQRAHALASYLEAWQSRNGLRLVRGEAG